MSKTFDQMGLAEFCKMLNEAKTTNFVLKKVKVLKAERKQGLALIGVPKTIRGRIDVIQGGERREFEFEAQEFEIFGN